MFNYSLDQREYTIKNVMLWGNFNAHAKKAGSGTLGNRVVHGLIAAAEFLPIVSQLASLIEYAVVKIFGSEIHIINGGAEVVDGAITFNAEQLSRGDSENFKDTSEVINTSNRVGVVTQDMLGFARIPEGCVLYNKAKDSSRVPPSYRFFNILTSPYKPLGYFDEGFWKEGDGYEWAVIKNGEIPGNKRIKVGCFDDFYNEDYLKKLLELNTDAFDPPQNVYDKNEIFDENNHVREGGIVYFIEQSHYNNLSGKLLSLIHAAYGDPSLYNVVGGVEGLVEGTRAYDLIHIPDEPGLRDIIHLKETFPAHTWKNIQVLLRAFNDVNHVREYLRTLNPSQKYYVQDMQVQVMDDSWPTYVVIVNTRTREKFLLKDDRIEPVTAQKG